MTCVYKRQCNEHGNRDEHGDAAGIVEPFADAESNAGQRRLGRDQDHRRRENSPLVVGHPRQRRYCIAQEGGCYETNNRDIQHDEEPQIPGDEKPDLIAEGETRPFVEAAFERHQAVEVSDDQCQRDEEEQHRR